ncbi:mth938 domain-containing protein isoform X1 [Sorex fumeus]|uniref:mth938 domain-containing protein isoform X1 n=1 Tax=Sorex fumeus TaxID=62283 RepID=UPI0024ACE495|nr:mth938 domain-containing protein isoform X1 [Sorex fumeus]
MEEEAARGRAGGSGAPGRGGPGGATAGGASEGAPGGGERLRRGAAIPQYNGGAEQSRGGPARAERRPGLSLAAAAATSPRRLAPPPGRALASCDKGMKTRAGAGLGAGGGSAGRHGQWAAGAGSAPHGRQPEVSPRAVAGL